MTRSITYWKRIVAENGAMVFDTKSQTYRSLALAAPTELLTALDDAGIPITAGEIILGTHREYETQCRSILAGISPAWRTITNRDSLMLLPAGIDKSTGLQDVLSELGLEWEQLIGVGDGENDLAFLERCGYSVAVANATSRVRSSVDYVTTHRAGEGVAELIELILTNRIPQ